MCLCTLQIDLTKHNINVKNTKSVFPAFSGQNSCLYVKSDGVEISSLLRLLSVSTSKPLPTSVVKQIVCGATET